MSFLNSRVVRHLHHYARIYDERAATRLWEYLLRAPFDGPEWVRSSQQPPTWEDPSDQRKVDYVIEYVSTENEATPVKVLMMEAKRYAAGENDIRKGEGQGWNAANKCSLYEGGHPMWFMSCVGTTARILIYDPQQEFPIDFFPGVFGLQHLWGDYVDVEEHGEGILTACKYISEHHRPPPKLLVQQSPPISSPGAQSEPVSSPISAARSALRAEALSQNPIPLSQEHWEFVNIHRNDGRNVSWRTEHGEAEFTAPVDAWSVRMREHDDQEEGCFVFMQPDTHNVYWTWTLQPDRPNVQTQQDSNPSGAVAGSSSAYPAEETTGGWVPVRVKRVQHTLSADEFIFTDKSGSKRTTKMKDWTKVHYNGRDTLAYHGKKTTYVIER